MNPKIKKLLLYTIPVGFGIFLVWNFLNKLTPTDQEEILNSFKSANYWWVLLSLFFGALSHLSRAIRWKYIMEPLGYQPRFPNLILTVLIAYLVNLIFPRAGEVARASALSKYEDIPFEKGFGTIVSERIADVIMLLLIAGIGFSLQGDLIKSYIIKDGESSYTKYILLTAVLLLGVGGLLLIKKSKIPFFVKMRTFFVGLYEGLVSILKMKKRWEFIFHTFFIWTMYILMFYVVTFSIPETSHLSLEAVIVGFIVGGLSMAVTNGGLGVYPVAIAGAFALYGIDEIYSSAFGWIMWSAQTLMILLFGGLSFLIIPFYNKAK